MAQPSLATSSLQRAPKRPAPHMGSTAGKLGHEPRLPLEGASPNSQPDLNCSAPNADSRAGGGQRKCFLPLVGEAVARLFEPQGSHYLGSRKTKTTALGTRVLHRWEAVALQPGLLTLGPPAKGCRILANKADGADGATWC